MTNHEFTESSHERERSPLTGLEGTYVGISPSDESNVGFGEIEVRIENQQVISRIATGWGILEDNFSTAEIRERPLEANVRAQLEPGMKARSFSYVSSQELTFLDSPDEGRQLLIIGGMGDILGPTILFGPEEVEQGKHEQLFDRLSQEMGGSADDVPRLQHGGKALNS